MSEWVRDMILCDHLLLALRSQKAADLGKWEVNQLYNNGTQ